MGRRKKLIEKLEKSHRQWRREFANDVTQADWYEALEDGRLPDGRTFEELGPEPHGDVHGDEI